MELPMLGTDEQTPSSKYQVTLVDQSDKRLKPMEYPRINRFFDTVDDRNSFVTLFETSIQKSGGRLVQDKLTHPLFVSFDILDKQGERHYSITIYH